MSSIIKTLRRHLRTPRTSSLRQPASLNLSPSPGFCVITRRVNTRLLKRYSGWASFLKARRVLRYRSAREYCLKAQLEISYPQYSRYESGDQLPPLEQCLQLCRTLDIPVLDGILEWSQAQMSIDSEKQQIRRVIEKLRDSGLA
jgi:hypothetical protein